MGAPLAVGSGATNVAKKKPSDDVSIGKFDILATYTYAQALLDGSTTTRRSSGAWWPRSWGLRHGWASAGSTTRSSRPQKEAAEKKKKTTITAESFDKQVAHKMGRFFDEVFLPTMKKLVEAGLPTTR